MVALADGLSLAGDSHPPTAVGVRSDCPGLYPCRPVHRSQAHAARSLGSRRRIYRLDGCVGWADCHVGTCIVLCLPPAASALSGDGGVMTDLCSKRLERARNSLEGLSVGDAFGVYH